MDSQNTQYLESEETILWMKRPSILPLLGVGTVWSLFISAVIWSYSTMYLQLGSLVGNALHLTALVVVGMHFWMIATRARYMVTDERVLVRTGGMRGRTIELPRQSVSSISASKGRIESLFNRGRVTLETQERSVTMSCLPAGEEQVLRMAQYFPNAEVDIESDVESQYDGVAWASLLDG